VYRAIVTVTLRPSILDPQGKAIHHALDSLGLAGVRDVRVGKRIVLDVEAASAAAAEALAQQAAEKLLANAVMEDFAVEVEALEAA
jgi:phosphoribosylformylglycinamidine synthase